jgi:5-formyltetrahydrofolate cyclo-ligase
MSSPLAALKKQIRTDIKSVLARYTADRIASESALTSMRALASAQYKRCSALSIFLSMPREVQTSQIIASAIADGKRVFIPKVLGPKPRDMVMVEINSLEEIDSFPKSAWGIPEPVLGSEFVDGTHLGVIDCVFVPGVAFDRRCGRLGHGRGYYGTLPDLQYFVL